MPYCPDIVVAGAAILDVLALPTDAAICERLSTPMEHIAMTTGGDALNEASVLAKLGRSVRLISRIGCDDAGQFIRSHCQTLGIDTRFHAVSGLDTGINVVLVDADGERRFLTNPHGSLRDLRVTDITLDAVQGAKIFCFASIFVSPKISPMELAQLFAAVRAQGTLVCADMTSPKHGETLADLAPALTQLDYLFANRTEAEQITGETNPERMAQLLLQTGVRHVVLKLGAQGCLIADAAHGFLRIPACPIHQLVDTTGAGDTFAAGFLSALRAHKPLLECGRFANACASLCVEAVGASGGIQTLAQAEQRCFESYLP